MGAVRFILRLSGFLALLVILGVATLYLWPLGEARLQGAIRYENIGYSTTQQIIKNTKQFESVLEGLRPECGTKVYDHGARTARAVLLLHGYTGCPSQFDGLAKQLYDKGYNVYVPRMPEHGFAGDSTRYSQIVASDLVDAADSALSITSGLGDEVGVIGISGGGVLATWLSQYRPDVVRRLEVISPFYEPSPLQVPSWQIKPLKLLYGYKKVADTYSGAGKTGFSYYGLAQYLLVVENLPAKLDKAKLSTFALVTSEHDSQINLTRAHDMVLTLRQNSTVGWYQDYRIPSDWNVGHDAVSGGGSSINGHEQDLWPVYVGLYEGLDQ